MPESPGDKKKSLQKLPQLERQKSFEDYTFEPTKKASGGRQQKAEDTGFYRENSTGNLLFIKKSKKHPADDIAEVVTSSILVDLLGEERALPYRFKDNIKGDVYLESDARDDFKPLGSQIKDRSGWLASNPKKLKNKKIIHEKLKGYESPMSKIVAANLFVKNSDCQVGNIFFYTDKHKEKQIGAFDFGWGLAGVCKEKNKVVNLLEKIDWAGSRATHTGALPTNHYVDYPFIIFSPDFFDALKTVANTALEKLRAEPNTVARALEKIDKHYIDDPVARLEAYTRFAKHLSIELTKHQESDIQEIKNLIQNKLTENLTARAESMLLLAPILQNVYNENLERLEYFKKTDIKSITSRQKNRQENRQENEFKKMFKDIREQVKYELGQVTTLHEYVKITPPLPPSLPKTVPPSLFRGARSPESEKETGFVFEEEDDVEGEFIEVEEIGEFLPEKSAEASSVPKELVSPASEKSESTEKAEEDASPSITRGTTSPSTRHTGKVSTLPTSSPAELTRHVTAPVKPEVAKVLSASPSLIPSKSIPDKSVLFSKHHNKQEPSSPAFTKKQEQKPAVKSTSKEEQTSHKTDIHSKIKAFEPKNDTPKEQVTVKPKDNKPQEKAMIKSWEKKIEEERQKTRPTEPTEHKPKNRGPSAKSG